MGKTNTNHTNTSGRITGTRLRQALHFVDPDEWSSVRGALLQWVLFLSGIVAVSTLLSGIGFYKMSQDAPQWQVFLIMAGVVLAGAAYVQVLKERAKHGSLSKTFGGAFIVLLACVGLFGLNGSGTVMGVADTAGSKVTAESRELSKELRQARDRVAAAEDKVRNQGELLTLKLGRMQRSYLAETDVTTNANRGFNTVRGPAAKALEAEMAGIEDQKEALLLEQAAARTELAAVERRVAAAEANLTGPAVLLTNAGVPYHLIPLVMGIAVMCVFDLILPLLATSRMGERYRDLAELLDDGCADYEQLVSEGRLDEVIGEARSTNWREDALLKLIS